MWLPEWYDANVHIEYSIFMIFSRRALYATVFGLLFLAGCHQPTPTDIVRDKVQKAVEKNKNSLADFGTLTSKNSTLTGNDAQGRPLWSLQFALGKIRNDNSNASRNGDLQNAKAVLFRDGKPQTTFSARKIRFFDGPKGLAMTLSEGVQATTQNIAIQSKNAKSSTRTKSSTQSAPSQPQLRQPTPAQLPVRMTTRQLQIDLGTKQVRADSPVTMTQGKTVVVAQKLSADTALAVARATDGVVATSPQGRTTSQNAVWSWAKNQAQMSGEVTVSRGETKLVGDVLDADAIGKRGTLKGKNGVSATSPQGQAKAQRLLYNWNEGRISAVGGVSMQKDGAVLRAQQVDSDDKLQRAQASGEVVLTRGDATVTAARLEAFDKMSRVVATNGVTLTRAGEMLSANGATFWLNEKRATASGNVRLTRIDAILTADRAEYSSRNGQATASGDVTIRRQGAVLKAGRATYWAQSGRAAASGGVTLVRGDVTINASRVEAENISDKSEAQIVAIGSVRAQRDGATVRGERVTWNHRGAVATGNVSLQKSGNTLGGARLEADAQFARAFLSGGVSGNLSNGAIFSARSMIWNRVLDGRVLPRNGRVTAQGGVLLRRAGLVLRASNLDAMGDGQSVLLSGGVVADGKDGAQVRSQSARYDAAKGQIVAQGDVWYKDASGNRLHGTHLVARLKGNTFQDATLQNVQGSGNSQIFSSKSLFGN